MKDYAMQALRHLILNIKNFMKYFKKGSWNTSKISWNFQIFQSEIFHRASLTGSWPLTCTVIVLDLVALGHNIWLYIMSDIASQMLVGTTVHIVSTGFWHFRSIFPLRRFTVKYRVLLVNRHMLVIRNWRYCVVWKLHNLHTSLSAVSY